MKLEKINENGLVRSSPFLNSFILMLFNSDQEVQMKVFSDLDVLLRSNSKNKQVIVASGIQNFFLQILYKFCF